MYHFIFKCPALYHVHEVQNQADCATPVFIYKLAKMAALGNTFGGCLLSMTTQNKCNSGK